MSVNTLFLKPELRAHISNILDISNTHNTDSETKIFDYLINLPGQIYRQVKNRKTLKVNLNKDYFIKTHQALSLREQIKNLLSLKWPVPNALDEQKAITAVQKLNINTMDIAGFGEYANDSFLITEAIEPNISLDQLLEAKIDTQDYFKLKRRLIKIIAQTTKLLHENGLNHRDYYVCHYLLKLDQNDHQISPENLYLIDLHRMQIRSRTPIRYIIKDLSSILFSIRNYKFTRTDYLRFIQYYTDNNLKKYRENKSFWQKVRNKANRLREKG